VLPKSCSDASERIYLLAPDGATIEQARTHNLSNEYSQRIIKDICGLPGETALKTLQLVKIENVLEDPIYGERIRFMADYNVRALF